MEIVNLILLFLSFALIGFIRRFEGWRNFFICFGIWVAVLGLWAMAMEALQIGGDSLEYKSAGFIVLAALNIGYLAYLFKKGYLGFFLKK